MQTWTYFTIVYVHNTSYLLSNKINIQIYVHAPVFLSFLFCLAMTNKFNVTEISKPWSMHYDYDKSKLHALYTTVARRVLKSVRISGNHMSHAPQNKSI